MRVPKHGPSTQACRLHQISLTALAVWCEEVQGKLPMQLRTTCLAPQRSTRPPLTCDAYAKSCDLVVAPQMADQIYSDFVKQPMPEAFDIFIKTLKRLGQGETTGSSGHILFDRMCIHVEMTIRGIMSAYTSIPSKIACIDDVQHAKRLRNE